LKTNEIFLGTVIKLGVSRKFIMIRWLAAPKCTVSLETTGIYQDFVRRTIYICTMQCNRTLVDFEH